MAACDFRAMTSRRWRAGEAGGHLGSYVTSQPEQLSVVADPWNLKLKPAKPKDVPFLSRTDVSIAKTSDKGTRGADKGNMLMPRKPSCEELEQRVKELEEEALEHKQVEERLRRHASELEQSNQELRQFAYVASHDLQEPLDAVTRYLRFVEARYMGRLDLDADEFIASAVDGANRIQSLITDLLAYLRRKDRDGDVVDYVEYV